MTLIYQALAEAFRAEDVRTIFVLMGDANMHCITAYRQLPGTRVISVRHEHCAVAAAIAHQQVVGGVAMASTTCGPGFTQVMTALTTAARNSIPLVVFAGEAPMHQAWYTQAVDQAALTVPTGARYVQIHSARLVHEQVRDAFWYARTKRCPVVIGVPYDLQKSELGSPGPYEPSSTLVPQIGRPLPDANQLDDVAERLLAARCPLLIAGRGVMETDADALVVELADRVGAILSNTLIARGMFDDHPFSMNISGGFSRMPAREVAAQADFVLALGASLTHYTVDGGRLYPNATLAQVDLEPQGYRAGLKAGDIHLRGDVKATIEALLDRIGNRPPASTIRTEALAAAFGGPQEDDTPYQVAPETLDPRAVVAEIGETITRDYFYIEGAGHSSYFPSVLRGFAPRRHLAIREFGAIGNSLSYALGVATENPDGKVMLIEGEGGFLMHVQELETIKREKLKLLMILFNDGAYGAEIHKLRHEGIDDSLAVFGRPDMAAVARGFGLRGAAITKQGQMRAALAEYEAGDTAMVWDVHVSDQVTSVRMKQMMGRGHGRP